ncbi:Protein of unknown function [Gryllus bimaculatus]|nr:Protein of unknown function [Gryllus bimaculatus]
MDSNTVIEGTVKFRDGKKGSFGRHRSELNDNQFHGGSELRLEAEVGMSSGTDLPRLSPANDVGVEGSRDVEVFGVEAFGQIALFYVGSVNFAITILFLCNIMVNSNNDDDDDDDDDDDVYMSKYQIIY